MASGSSSSFKSLNDPYQLIDFLRGGLGGNPTLYVISVDWVGCGACGTPDSPYLAIRDSLPARFRDCDPAPRFGVIDWRLADSFGEPVLQAYKLLLYLTRGKKQLFGGGRYVETFTNLDEPTYWRPKFPQLFLLDGRQTDQAALGTIAADNAFHDFVSPVSFSPLINHERQIVDNERALEPLKRVMSGDLKLELPDMLEHLSNSIDSERGVLLQLTNFNMYKDDGDRPEDFMADDVLEACDCAVKGFYADPVVATDCVRFDRRECGTNANA